jgi:hypothetical protein
VAAPQRAARLMERVEGSQLVAGAAAGSIAQAGILAQGRLALYCGGDEKVSTQRPVRLVGIGPRVTPSQRSHPMPQPFAARRTASQTTWAAVGYGGGGRPARPAENGVPHSILWGRWGKCRTKPKTRLAIGAAEVAG